MAEDIQTVAGRPHWTVENNVATYIPLEGGWITKVRSSQQAKYYAKWHIAIIDPKGYARSVSSASLPRRSRRGR